jgi:lipopolysaccharide transport system ATP-binding protein
MSRIAISIENLSKLYRLGQIGTGTLSQDINVWWAKLRGKPNPLLKIGQAEYFNSDGADLWALRDINFTIQQGDVLGIIGRNGAGKSTLLKILSRVTAPTSGKIKVMGRIASLLEVGTGFHPDLTGRENIYLNGAILGMTRREITRKFDEIINFAEVEKFVDTPVKRYSSGMYVRLAFAVAAHLDPDILVVDEVLAVGDAEFQKKCLGKMGDVAKEGRTVLFVSHNMAAVEQLCHSCILLSKGLLVKAGGVRTIIDYYLNIPLADGKFNEIFGLRNNSTIKLIDFGVSNGDTNSKQLIKIGDDVYFSMKLFSKNIHSKIKITIGINNSRGLRVAILHSEMSGFRLALAEGENIFTCHVPTLNLVEGTYNLDIRIYFGNEPILSAQNFYQFTVHPGNFFNSGKLPDPAWGGICYMQQSWEVDEKIKD